MTTVDQTKRWTFIIGFGLIALFINALPRRYSVFQAPVISQPVTASRPAIQYIPTAPPQPMPPPAPVVAAPQVDMAAKAAEDAAARHAHELARYINEGVPRASDTKLIAIVSVAEDGTFNDEVGSAITSKLGSNGVETISSYFTPEFVSDGLFKQTFGGSRALWNRLELMNALDGLLLARERVTYSTSGPDLENVISALMTLEVKVMPASAQKHGAAWEFQASGAGFKREEARAMAQERILKKMLSDTNFILKQ